MDSGRQSVKTTKPKLNHDQRRATHSKSGQSGPRLDEGGSSSSSRRSEGNGGKGEREAGPANCTRFTMRCRHIKNRLSAWTKAGERGAKAVLKGRGRGSTHRQRAPTMWHSDTFAAAAALLNQFTI